MQFNTFISSAEDLKKCISSGIREVLIAPSLLAREGFLDLSQALDLAKLARAINLQPVLVWDILMPQSDFEDCSSILSSIKIQNYFSAVRVQDIGALSWMKEKYPLIDIHLIAETGNSNIHALRRWEETIGAQLARFILSMQLPEDELVEYCKILSTPCEILAAGPILIFYSPRQLLRSTLAQLNSIDDDTDWIFALSSSEESHSRDFPTVENSHGTFMYLNKDLCVLDKLDNLKSAGLYAARIDLRQKSSRPHSAEHIDTLINKLSSGSFSIKDDWGIAFAPFFKSNRTTRRFTTLKPVIHQIRNENCIARVVESTKPKSIICQALRDFTVSNSYQLIIPDGTAITIENLDFRDLSGNTQTNFSEDHLFQVPWVKKSCKGAMLFECSFAAMPS